MSQRPCAGSDGVVTTASIRGIVKITIPYLPVIAVCLRNEVFKVDNVNLNFLPEFLNAAQHKWLQLNHFSYTV